MAEAGGVGGALIFVGDADSFFFPCLFFGLLLSHTTIIESAFCPKFSYLPVSFGSPSV